MILPLNQMSVEEKLRAMEELWEDLSRNADAFDSPDWHADVLREREERLASGQDSFTDWERAKIEIRQQLE